ncbi:hypothetical protein ABW21_db0207403 [Orbilia brochopaga]|nr:hypothetical protein ABW21_db0207403 [Drechslerella brochopaga]
MKLTAQVLSFALALAGLTTAEEEAPSFRLERRTKLKNDPAPLFLGPDKKYKYVTCYNNDNKFNWVFSAEPQWKDDKMTRHKCWDWCNKHAAKNNLPCYKYIGLQNGNMSSQCTNKLNPQAKPWDPKVVDNHCVVACKGNPKEHKNVKCGGPHAMTLFERIDDSCTPPAPAPPPPKPKKTWKKKKQQPKVINVVVTKTIYEVLNRNKDDKDDKDDKNDKDDDKEDDDKPAPQNGGY